MNFKKNTVKLKEKARQRREEKLYLQVRRRIVNVIVWFALAVVVGTFGYYFLYDGEQEITLMSCAFMSIITMSTVGYGEIVPVTGDIKLEIFTGFMILFGIGITVYFTSVLTAFIVGGELLLVWRTRRVQKQVDKLSHHYIIGGVGQVGFHVADELLQSKRQIVIVDRSLERIEAFLEHHGVEIPFFVGDVTDDDVLKDAGIEAADGIVFALDNDHENLFATITARTLNPEIRIISRGQDETSRQKFLRAGANKVIFANVIGAMRMASETIRPSVVTFLDLMLKDREHPRRVEEIVVPMSSRAVGKSLRDLHVRDCTDALILAVQRPQVGHEEPGFDFNPGPDYVLQANCKLVVMSLVEDLPILQAMARGETPKRKRR